MPNVRRIAGATVLLLGAVFAIASARAGVVGETGATASLAVPGDHAFLLIDVFGGYLFDGDSGAMLGKLNTSNFTVAVAVDAARRQLYVPGSFYSRLTYGERTDVVMVNDFEHLAPVAEVELPKKLAATGHRGSLGLVGERHLVLYNMTPAMSVSVVDVERRAFVREIATAGCALVYPVARAFLQICGDGRLQRVTLDARGAEAGRVQSEVFFDVGVDPIFDYAVPTAAGWLFVSFEGNVFEARSDAGILLSDPWSILGDDDREQKWRIGGSQPFAYNAATGTLFTLMHQGEKDTHEDDGTEIWAFDARRERRGYRLKLAEPAYAIEVTSDAAPLLLVVSTQPRTVYVHDASTGRHLRTIEEAGYLPRRIQRFR